MDGKKVFIGVLILLALLFAVGMILVAARPDPPPKDPEREPGSFEKFLDGALGAMRPRDRKSVV